jgi:hypothetical protein
MAEVEVDVVGQGTRVELVFPDAILEALVQRLAALKLVHYPSPPVLRQLVNTAYFASLTPEESKLHPFTIAFFSPHDTAYSVPQRGWAPIVFRDPRPFTPAEVAKLSPALDFSQTAMCVCEGTAGALEIWGLLIHSRSIHKLRTGESSGGFSLGPPHLRIRVPHSGHLIFEEGITRIIEYRIGEIVTDPLPVFREDGPILRFLQSYKCPRELPIGYPFALLARRILDLGHGGMVLLVNEDRIAAAQKALDVKYKQEHDFNYLEWLGQAAEIQQLFRQQSYTNADRSDWRVRDYQIAEAFEHIKEAAEALANLAMVDGALVLTTRLNVLGFGAKVQSPPPSQAYRALNTLGSQAETIDLKTFGTRHNAAAAFANQFPDALAYVCSEDGVASVFKSRADKLLLWRPIDLEVSSKMRPSDFS